MRTIVERANIHLTGAKILTWKAIECAHNGESQLARQYELQARTLRAEGERLTREAARAAA